MALVSIGEALNAASSILGLGALRTGLLPLGAAIPDADDPADRAGPDDIAPDAMNESLFEAVETALREAGYLRA
ncbi:hypothetical protein U8607_20640 [Methylobacterium durans]|uniref:hypothetical protein n=1 Tax=Methylobacterium durans TaxID=2202825 RepID=UPI002AFF153B|nr:hypothetical protein [Methylobacterium durans]MEA1834505.1 hypothetical protein [Methylobacterium durans]